jgi:putative tricarboxylic transport membrane protein
MPAKLRQVLPHAVMLVASLLLYWAATRIDVDTGGRIGPDVWPKAIIVFMGLLCAWEIVKRLAAKSAPEAVGLVAELKAPPVAVAEGKAPTPEHPRMLAGGIALIAAYVVTVPWIGFFVATAIFLAVFPWIGGLRRPVLSAILGIGGSFVLIVIFMRVAYISLPLGEGPFRALSLALMRAIGVV